MPKRKPERKPEEKRDDKLRSKDRVEDLPVKDEQAAGVKGGRQVNGRDGTEAQHNETLVRA